MMKERILIEECRRKHSDEGQRLMKKKKKAVLKLPLLHGAGLSDG